MLIDFNVGAFRLQFQHAFKTALMDGWGMMIAWPMNFEWVANRSLGGKKVCRLGFSINGGAGIFLIGEDVLENLRHLDVENPMVDQDDSNQRLHHDDYRRRQMSIGR